MARVKRVKNVVICNQGGHRWLSAEAGDYDKWVESLEQQFALLNQEAGEGDPVVKFRTIDDVELITQDLAAGKVDILIFPTLGMLQEADRLKEKYGRVQVFVCTGAINEVNRAIVLDKLWLDGEGSVGRIVLGQWR